MNKYLTDEAKAAYAIALRDRDLGILSDDEQLTIKIKVQLLADKLNGKACELARIMATMGIKFEIVSDRCNSLIAFYCNGESFSLHFNEDGSFNRQEFSSWGKCTSQGEI